MPSPTTFPGDIIVPGQVIAAQNIPSAGSITDNMVAGSAAIAASKQEHQHQHSYAQPGASNAAVERKVIHVVRGATARVQEFKVGATTAATSDATATIDLKKNNTSLLTGTISLTSATAAYGLLAGTLAAGALTLVAGDVLEVVVSAVNAGSGALAKGLFAELTIREDAA